jgi:hypothetical protein
MQEIYFLLHTEFLLKIRYNSHMNTLNDTAKKYAETLVRYHQLNDINDMLKSTASKQAFARVRHELYMVQNTLNILAMNVALKG